MNTIRKIRIIYQREIGKIVRYENNEKQPKKENIMNFINNNEIDENKEENLEGQITDGKWLVIQKWTQCTLKCGGGKSYLQRMCIPPKNGGKPCEGDAILAKNCNIQPCPEVKHNIEPTFNSQDILSSHIKQIKQMPLFNQPLRYRKCVIKEGDVLFNKYFNNTNNIEQYTNENMKYKTQIPARAIMNNMTFSIFEGENYSTNVMTFNLNKSQFEKIYKEGQYCFILSESLEKMAKVCPLTYNSQEGKVLDWEKDFNIFKTKCESKSDNQKMTIQNNFDNKLKDAVAKLVQQHEIDKKEGIYNSYEDSLKNIDKDAFDAIMQEVSLEEIVKNKEIEKENREEQELLDLIEKEKVKKVRFINIH